MDITQERILDAAESLLGQLGYQKMTMDDLAAEAGLSRATIYLRYRGKEEVALATVDRIHLRMLDRLTAIVNEEPDPFVCVERFLVGRVLFALDDADATHPRVENVVSSIRPRYMERRETYLRNEAALLASVLRRGAESGVSWAEDCDTVAMCCLLATNALMPFSLSARMIRERTEVEAAAVRIARLLVAGLQARV